MNRSLNGKLKYTPQKEYQDKQEVPVVNLTLRRKGTELPVGQ